MTLKMQRLYRFAKWRVGGVEDFVHLGR